MISFAEFEIALRGLLRLARFDANFTGFFDLSRDGARRSFRLALLLLLPVLFLWNLNSDLPDGADMVRVGLGELIGYALGWICFPLILLSIARLIDRESRIYGAIAIYNWLSILGVVLQFPIAIAAYFGLSDAWYGGISDLALLFVTACEYFAFRRILEIRIEMVIALVVVDFILTHIIFALMVGMIHNQLF